jgi:hypothetical protein
LILALAPISTGAVEPVPPAGTPYGVDEKPFGMSLAEWEAAWNEWFYSIPKASSPMTGGRGKLSGVGQRMPVWFLPTFDPGDHTFSQNIPSGYALFVPVLNEVHADYGTSVLASFTEGQAKFITKELDQLPVPGVDIDGVSVPDLARYRAQTPMFSFLLPEGNLFGRDVPSGSTLHMQAIAEGYNLLVPPLSAGKHVIHTQAMLFGDKNAIVPVNTTYQLIVLAWPR